MEAASLIVPIVKILFVSQLLIVYGSEMLERDSNFRKGNEKGKRKDEKKLQREKATKQNLCEKEKSISAGMLSIGSSIKPSCSPNHLT